MPKKTKTPKNDPIAVIKRIARAMETKVRFGSPTTEPSKHWCEILNIVESPVPNSFIGWGSNDQEAATNCLQDMVSRVFMKSEKGHLIYYRIIPGHNGYYVISAKSRISKTLIRI